MNTFIAYDKNTYQILGFIRNSYTTIEETKEVFKNFENYDVKQTALEIPNNFSKYKVVLKDGELIGFEEMEVEDANIQI